MHVFHEIPGVSADNEARAAPSDADFRCSRERTFAEDDTEDVLPARIYSARIRRTKKSRARRGWLEEIASTGVNCISGRGVQSKVGLKLCGMRETKAFLSVFDCRIEIFCAMCNKNEAH